MQKVLITGSSGFIGRSLTKYLRKHGKFIIEYDIKMGRDILDYEQLRAVFKNYDPDQVYHLAAQAFVEPGEIDPYRDLDINGKGMLNILRCIDEFRVPMVFTSSGAVYGRSDHDLHIENTVLRPTAFYGCSKRYAELALQKEVMTKEIDAKIVRFSSVYGPGRGKQGAVNAFIEFALEGKPLTIHGDGNQTRDMVAWVDACDGTELVMNKGISGEVYNIGYGKSHTVKEVAEIISDLTGVPIIHQEYKFSKFNIKYSNLDISKAKHELGYNPTVDLMTGIKKLLKEEKHYRLPFSNG